MPRVKDKYPQKQQQLIERTMRSLNVGEGEARSLLSIQRRQSVRVNTLARPISDVVPELEALGVTLRPVLWMPEGFFIEEGHDLVNNSTLSQTGDIYIQNAASWLPVIVLDPQPNERVLDVCAAPGGKTSHIAQMAGNQANIYANDNSRPRLMRLQKNLERLSVMNAATTLHDATRLTSHFEPQFFDKILLDAPCSGEGMMTLEDKKAFESWSVAHIKRLQQLQKRLLVQAWQLLRPGGTLVYSTCTMAPEENEAVVDYLLRHNDDVIVEDLSYIHSQLPNAVPAVLKWNGKQFDTRLNQALRLRPSLDIEAFFVVKLTKTEASQRGA